MHTADMLIHIHPDLDIQARMQLERRLMGCVGVDCAEFNHRLQPHAMIVKYNPDEIQGMDILKIVRIVDPVASRVGL